MTKRTLARDELRRSPGTMGDALMALQNLPGIARPPPFAGVLVVRGSEPQETLVHIDGTEVPLVYHFGGLSSVVPSEIIHEIDFFPGNFGAQYGRAILVVPGNENSGTGQAYGVEWLLRHKLTDDFFGWISYTLSRSERRKVPGDPLTPFRFDQTHVLTMLGNYRLGRGWQLGARFRLSSGELYTPVTTGAYNATVGTQLGVAEVPPYASRLPIFDQLDLRIERQLKPYRGITWTWFLDLQNVYFANNPLGVTYNYDYTESAPVNGLPILPIIGVRGEN